MTARPVVRAGCFASYQPESRLAGWGVPIDRRRVAVRRRRLAVGRRGLPAARGERRPQPPRQSSWRTLPARLRRPAAPAAAPRVARRRRLPPVRFAAAHRALEERTVVDGEQAVGDLALDMGRVLDDDHGRPDRACDPAAHDRLLGDDGAGDGGVLPTISCARARSRMRPSIRTSPAECRSPTMVSEHRRRTGSACRAPPAMWRSSGGPAAHQLRVGLLRSIRWVLR